MTGRLPFTGNKLKLIAAATMLIDHVGYCIFPMSAYPWGYLLRLVGRLAMPLFAWCVAEGAIHTRSRAKYLLRMAVMAVAVQTVYYIFEKSFHMYIPVVWFLSLVIIFAWRDFFHSLSGAKKYSALRALVFIAAVLSAYLFCRYFDVDYGFAGVLIPVFGALTNSLNKNKAIFSAALVAITVITWSSSQGGFPLQYYSLAAILPVLLYNGRRGEARLKWFFWVFYPAHLAVILTVAKLLGRL